MPNHGLRHGRLTPPVKAGPRYSVNKMEIDKPQWALKTARCLYCDEGEMVFSRCPSCQVIILICAECGTAYEIDHKKIGEEVGDITGATRCQRCGNAFQHEFPPATSDEIQALGFTAKDYQ